MQPIFIVLLVLLGTATGFAAGLLGIGGGMLMVPFLTMMFSARGFPPAHVVHIAIATSLATILFTSISSVRAHHRRGAVLWKVAAMFTPGILIGSWIGPMIAAALNTAMLSGFFALFVGYSAVNMLRNKKPKPSRELPGWPGMIGAGVAVGTASGMVGAGGGFISIPFMTWCNVPIHRAVATSAALGFPIALAGTLSNIWHGLDIPDLPSGSLGFIYTPALLSIALASVCTAPLGARLAHALDMAQLKKVFAILLFALAGYMAWKAVHG